MYPTLEEAQAFSELPPRGGDRIQRRSQNSTSTSNAPDNTTLKITSNANSTTNTNNALQVKEKAAEGEDCVLFWAAPFLALFISVTTFLFEL